MDSAESKSAQERLTASLVQVTRTVGQVAAEDLNFHRSFNQDAADLIDEQSQRFLKLTNTLLKAVTEDTNIQPPTIKDQDSLEENWSGVVDTIDSLLEKADACLDEFTGVIKKLSPTEEEQAPVLKKTSNFTTMFDYGPSKIPKPQLLFDHKVDNSNIEPFRPLLQTKPHAIVPLETALQKTQINGKEGYPNPYESEIRAAQYPKNVYKISPPINYLPFESTNATFVDTLDGVKEMLKELKEADEIAIDLEHHDIHSYHGLVSLMQISTRTKDWVVDTLKPWRVELQILNEVFADPKILKVLHGSHMDIIWLQRDLGLYVVGLFDTFHAASALGYPKKSLKYLLHKFINLDADKQYQTSDWRIRPLPDVMFDYARSDTHYLLYIYDNLRNELIEASTSDPDGNLIDYVKERSNAETLQRYERPVYDEEHGSGQGGWYDLLSRNPGILSKEQFAVFKAMHKWRDEVARAEDEGWPCVFPKHILFRAAMNMPTDMGTLLRTMSPMTPIMKDRAHELLDVIKEAKIAGANGPEWRDVAPRPKKSHITVPVETKPKPAEYKYKYGSVRAETSIGFGGIMDYKRTRPPPEYTRAALAQAIKLAVPYPEMPATISEVQESVGADKSGLNTPNAQYSQEPQESLESQDSQDSEDSPAPAPEAEEKAIFTVKERGRPQKKRKVTPVDQPEQGPSMGLDGAADEVSLDPDYETKDRKKSRKEKKAAKKAEKVAANSVPFDYGAADSVLNAPSAEVPGAQPKNRKKAFDPYRKALEAPSGVRKFKRDDSGKSHTFRN